MLIAKYIRCLL